MITDNREVDLIKKAIEDYYFISEEISQKIEKCKELTKKEIICVLERFLKKFKNIDISNVELYNDYGYLDFIYNDINMSVFYGNDNVVVSKTFEIWDAKKDEYIIEDYLSVDEYYKLINEYHKRTKLEEDKRKIKEELEEELREKFGEIELNIIKKYENKYNISWSLGIPITIDFVLFEDIKGDKND